MTTEPATYESVWEIIRETQKMQQDNEKRQKETDRLLQDLIKRQEQTDRQIDKTDRQIDKMYRSIKHLNKTVSGLGTTRGSFAEQYFYNSFKKGQKNFFGESFDKIEKNIHGLKVDAEYDIVLVNGKSIGIIEVKFDARKEDIKEVIKKAETFRINYSDFAKHHIYLGLAALTFEKDVEKDCTQAGIAIIKQDGKAVVIYDEHLKKF